MLYVRLYLILIVPCQIHHYFVITYYLFFPSSPEKYWEMNSFSESQALKLAMSRAEEFVNHNKKFLARIYPNGMRVDSTNYNPQDLWNCGCQMGKSLTLSVSE